MIELPEHPWFIGCQFHPEYTSDPRDGHPLFTGFITAALDYNESGQKSEKSGGSAVNTSSATATPVT